MIKSLLGSLLERKRLKLVNSSNLIREGDESAMRRQSQVNVYLELSVVRNSIYLNKKMYILMSGSLNIFEFKALFRGRELGFDRRMFDRDLRCCR